MFKQAYQAKRCVVPVSGFYEWTGDKKARLPWYITAADRTPLSFAGLWETWRNPDDGEAVRSFTIITTEANAFMSKIHNRMPVVLSRDGVQEWLSAADAALLRPAPEDVLQAYRVDPRVNSNRYQEADTVTPLAGVDAI